MENNELTAADVWKMFAETNEQMRETDRKFAETDRKFAETDRKFAEEREQMREQMQENAKFQKEVSQQIRELNKEFGGLSRNAGLHAEEYFQNALGESLVFGKQKYDKMIPNLKYKHKNINAEFDIVLINGKNTALIETKNRVHASFIKEFAEEKLASFKKYFPEFCKSNVYLGVAGFSFEEKVLSETKKFGIGVIRQVGKSIEVSADNLRAY